MATDRLKPSGRWTLLLWGGSALLLSAPFIAMRFTSEVDWSAADFLVMGLMLGIVCGAVELTVRLTDDLAYRLGAAAAIGGAFLISWANLAVGIVGSEDNPFNNLFFYALLVGPAGAIIARFRARGMAFAMLATAGGLAAAFVVAASHTAEEGNVSHWRELIATSVIASPLLLSAWLFRKAAKSVRMGSR